MTNFDCYYLRLRNYDDYKTPCDLIVASRLILSLDQETQMHTGIRQGNKWFRTTEMESECDTFYISNSTECSNRDLKYVSPH